MKSVETTIVWVTPKRLENRWQPEMFRAEYLELDRQIQSWSAVARLGDLVSIVNTPAIVGEAIWKISASKGVTRSFPEPLLDDAFKSRFTALPDRALLVTRTWFDHPKTLYWDSNIYRGTAVADSHFFVLQGRTGESIAWIQKALTSEYGSHQLKRHAVGSTLVSISTSDLLDIRVQLPSEQERTRISREIVATEQQNAVKLRSRALNNAVVLAGHTHEDRLGELEELLIRDFEIPPSDIYFIEPATKNRQSDLFTVRRVSEKRDSAATSLVPQANPLANEQWKNWFWNSDRKECHRVFNSFVIDSPLPTHLLLHIAPELPATITEKAAPKLFPGFLTFRDALRESLNHDVGAEDSIWAEAWSELQDNFAAVVSPGSYAFKGSENRSIRASTVFDFENELFAWSRRTYRPVLALKIWHDDEIAGAYLLVGDDQIYNQHSAFARLDDLGVELSEILQGGVTQTDEGMRRESLRRLNDIMHRLNGPLLDANDAIRDIDQFLGEQPDIAAMLVPNEKQARAMAEMNRDSSDVRYQLASRFEAIAAAIAQIRGLSTQIKTLARIEERLTLTEFSLENLANDLEKYNAVIRPVFSYVRHVDPGTRICGDRDLITVALGRVLDNSIREIQEKRVHAPKISMTFSRIGDEVQIQIEDNALPQDEFLPPNVFDERVSKYFRNNKGSGFGLMSVKRIFERHKSRVSLDENVDADGVRLPGVTFMASLQLARIEGTDSGQ